MTRPTHHLDASDHYALLAVEARYRGAPEEADALVRISLSRLSLAIELRDQERWRERIAGA